MLQFLAGYQRLARAFLFGALALVLSACPAGSGGDPPADDDDTPPLGQIDEDFTGLWTESLTNTSEIGERSWFIDGRGIVLTTKKREFTAKVFSSIDSENIVFSVGTDGNSLSGTTALGERFAIRLSGAEGMLRLSSTSLQNDVILLRVRAPQAGFSFSARFIEPAGSRALGPAIGINLIIRNILNSYDVATIVDKQDGSYGVEGAKPGELYLISPQPGAGIDSSVSAFPFQASFLDPGADLGTYTMTDSAIEYSFKLSLAPEDALAGSANPWNAFAYESYPGELEPFRLRLLRLTNIGSETSPAGLSYQFTMPNDNATIHSSEYGLPSAMETLTSASGSLPSLEANESLYFRLRIGPTTVEGAALDQELGLRIEGAAAGGRVWDDSYQWRVYKDKLRLSLKAGFVAALRIASEQVSGYVLDSAWIPKTGIAGDITAAVFETRGEDVDYYRGVYDISCIGSGDLTGSGPALRGIAPYWSYDEISQGASFLEAIHEPDDDLPEGATPLHERSTRLGYVGPDDVDRFVLVEDDPAEGYELAATVDRSSAFSALLGSPAIASLNLPETHYHARAVLDAAGVIHAAFRSQRSDSESAILYCAIEDGMPGELEIVERASGTSQLQLGEMLVGTDGTVHIAAAELSASPKQIFYRKASGGSWTREEIPGLSSPVAERHTMVFDANGEPVIFALKQRAARDGEGNWSIDSTSISFGGFERGIALPSATGFLFVASKLLRAPQSTNSPNYVFSFGTAETAGASSFAYKDRDRVWYMTGNHLPPQVLLSPLDGSRVLTYRLYGFPDYNGYQNRSDWSRELGDAWLLCEEGDHYLERKFPPHAFSPSGTHYYADPAARRKEAGASYADQAWSGTGDSMLWVNPSDDPSSLRGHLLAEDFCTITLESGYTDYARGRPDRAFSELIAESDELLHLIETLPEGFVYYRIERRP